MKLRPSSAQLVINIYLSDVFLPSGSNKHICHFLRIVGSEILQQPISDVFLPSGSNKHICHFLRIVGSEILQQPISDGWPLITSCAEQVGLMAKHKTKP